VGCQHQVTGKQFFSAPVPYLSLLTGVLLLVPMGRVCYSVIVVFAFLLMAGCGGSQSSSGGGGTQPQVTVSITGTPPSTIGAGANWQYAATVAGSSNQSVTWTATGGGTIDASTGVYIAPNSVPNPPTVTITAAAQSDPTQVAATTLTVLAHDPLGTVMSYTQFPGPNSCPTGGLPNGTCFQLAISCPGVADFSAYLKVYTPPGTSIGTVLFGVGTGGSGLYEDPSTGYADGSTSVGDILNFGFNTVQVSFGAPFDQGSTPRGWLTGPGGVRRLACRYATVADWVYNHPAIINPTVTATTSAPLCATGNSGGSAAIAYGVYEYGLDSEFAMIEPTSGPVMSRIDEGCSPCSLTLQGNVCPGSNNNPNMCYESADASIIDEAYQSPGATSPTPCTDALNGNPGPNASNLFLSDSILWAGPISIPNTILHQLFADDDTSNAVPQGILWQGLVTPSSSSPVPRYACLPGVQHDIPSYPTGATQIANDIIAYCH
jgi:hypothetical protein